MLLLFLIGAPTCLCPSWLLRRNGKCWKAFALSGLWGGKGWLAFAPHRFHHMHGLPVRWLAGSCREHQVTQLLMGCREQISMRRDFHILSQPGRGQDHKRMTTVCTARDFKAPDNWTRVLAMWWFCNKKVDKSWLTCVSPCWDQLLFGNHLLFSSDRKHDGRNYYIVTLFEKPSSRQL